MLRDSRLEPVDICSRKSSGKTTPQDFRAQVCWHRFQNFLDLTLFSLETRCVYYFRTLAEIGFSEDELFDFIDRLWAFNGDSRGENVLWKFVFIVFAFVFENKLFSFRQDKRRRWRGLLQVQVLHEVKLPFFHFQSQNSFSE